MTAIPNKGHLTSRLNMHKLCPLFFHCNASDKPAQFDGGWPHGCRARVKQLQSKTVAEWNSCRVQWQARPKTLGRSNCMLSPQSKLCLFLVAVLNPASLSLLRNMELLAPAHLISCQCFDTNKIMPTRQVRLLKLGGLILRPTAS